jgi:hypothetical protein
MGQLARRDPLIAASALPSPAARAVLRATVAATAGRPGMRWSSSPGCAQPACWCGKCWRRGPFAHSPATRRSRPARRRRMVSAVGVAELRLCHADPQRLLPGSLPIALTMETAGASGAVNRLLRPESVRHMSVTTATQRLTAAHHETQGTRQRRPARPGGRETAIQTDPGGTAPPARSVPDAPLAAGAYGPWRARRGASRPRGRRSSDVSRLIGAARGT